MKAGIITFHRSINFGAVLQAYALKTTIDKLGVQAQIINYTTEHLEKNVKMERLLTKLRLAKNPIKMMSVLIYGYYIKQKKNKFIEFSNEKLSLTKIFSCKNIEQLSDAFDIFITGSDQVWNDQCTGFDKNYFLSFVKNSFKKNSYSASFGFDKIPDEHYSEYKKLLSDFNNISVREQKGFEIIYDLLKRNIEVTLDPTLLLRANQWLEIARPATNLKNYILVYEMAHSDRLINFISKLQKQTGLQVVFISNKYEKKIKKTINIRGAGPKEFISLFNNARYIVTNSFHGICFSIIFEKTFFAELLPSPSKVNSRITNILSLFNLNNRFTDNFSDSKVIDIDYTEANKILDNERQKSVDYLKKILNGASEQ